MGLDYRVGDIVTTPNAGECEVLAFENGKVKLRPLNGARVRSVIPGTITGFVRGADEEQKTVSVRVTDDPGEAAMELDEKEAEERAQLPAVQRSAPMVELGVDDVVAQVAKVQQLMRAVMQDGTHFGTIPGCGDKKNLLKPGAEKLSLCFQLVPQFDVDMTELPPVGDVTGHREYHVTCKLIRSNSGLFAGEGVGMCSTMESKYRYRTAELVCPSCGKPAVIRGKKDFGGGWLCWGKKGGCGAKWGDRSPEAERFGSFQAKTENTNPADTHNTVLKIAKKRAHVDAIITALSVSDMFTQDLEDLQANQAATESQAEERPTNAPQSAHGRPNGPQGGWSPDEYGDPPDADGEYGEPAGRSQTSPTGKMPERSRRVEQYLEQAARCRTLEELAALATEVADSGLSAAEREQARGPWRQIRANLAAEAGPEANHAHPY